MGCQISQSNNTITAAKKDRQIDRQMIDRQIERERERERERDDTK